MKEVLEKTCAYCGKHAEGEFSIHRDGFGEGPEVDLCNDCGGSSGPSCEEIWERSLSSVMPVLTKP